MINIEKDEQKLEDNSTSSNSENDFKELDNEIDKVVRGKVSFEEEKLNYISDEDSNPNLKNIQNLSKISPIFYRNSNSIKNFNLVQSKKLNYLNNKQKENIFTQKQHKTNLIPSLIDSNKTQINNVLLKDSNINNFNQIHLKNANNNNLFYNNSNINNNQMNNNIIQDMNNIYLNELISIYNHSFNNCQNNGQNNLNYFINNSIINKNKNFNNNINLSYININLNNNSNQQEIRNKIILNNNYFNYLCNNNYNQNIYNNYIYNLNHNYDSLSIQLKIKLLNNIFNETRKNLFIFNKFNNSIKSNLFNNKSCNDNNNSNINNKNIDKKPNFVEEKSKNNSQRKKNNNTKYGLNINKNIINLLEVFLCKDRRTTLMIKNIPNKYTISSFLEEINVNFKYTYDIFYLPIDYVNKCNLGFAFINFVEPFHLILFYELYLGKKWKKFNSDKICELLYAKFQGRKDLIAHFEKGKVLSMESEEKRPLIMDTPNPLPNINLPLYYLDLFIKLYPNISYEIRDSENNRNNNGNKNIYSSLIPVFTIKGNFLSNFK